MRIADRDFKLHLQLLLKSVVDVGISGTILLILSPLFLLASLAAKLETRGPIFSVKHAYCYGGRHIKLLRFRSRSRRDLAVWGRFLIRTGLDRLPMLINVLRAEISIVGLRLYDLPPPQLNNQLLPVSLETRFKPGLVSFKGRRDGRELSHAEADLFYLSNYSFGLDLKILGHYLVFNSMSFQNLSDR
jgi:putative colanic acid biosysnthesis UDP-glucose lipid carrier transferase